MISCSIFTRHIGLSVIACLGSLLLLASPVRADNSRADYLQEPPTCSISGTNEDDVLQGTADGDVICGLGGDDTIVGRDGDDVLRGGPGNDLLVGGPGRDRLYGDDDDDQLVDTRLPSIVDGGAGVDLCVAVADSEAAGCERLFLLSGTRS